MNGLQRLQIDQSTGDELLRTVPYLVRGQRDRTEGSRTVRTYSLAISNESDWLLLTRLAYALRGDWLPPLRPYTGADWLGFRYLRFRAEVILLDGKVSNIGFGIAPEWVAPRQFGEILAVESFHGFWSSYRRPIDVTSSDDESPQDRIAGGNEPRRLGPSGSKDSLQVSYAFDAPADLTSRAFQVNLSCFWGLLGCRSAGQIAPLAWQDKQAIDAAAVARLKSAEPCPDRIPAGRVRYLLDLDLDLLLLEVTNTRTERINEEGRDLDEHYSDDRVVENLRGNSQRTWNSVRCREWIPSPSDPGHMIFNPARNMLLRPGDRELMFTNLDIDSCAAVPGTPSALSVVRGAVPAPKRAEDELLPRMLL